jgi:excisionase family DNA binding protein
VTATIDRAHHHTANRLVAQGKRGGRTTMDEKTTVPALLYRVDEAAEALRLSRSSIYELIRSGQLRTVKHGSRRLVPVEALDDFVCALAEAAS